MSRRAINSLNYSERSNPGVIRRDRPLLLLGLGQDICYDNAGSNSELLAF